MILMLSDNTCFLCKHWAVDVIALKRPLAASLFPVFIQKD